MSYYDLHFHHLITNLTNPCSLLGGGCAIPLTLGSPQGIDCTAIPGVADVACHSGACVVHRCLPGYTVSHDKSFCIHTASLNFGHDVPAAAYGLEHKPFNKKEE